MKKQTKTLILSVVVTLILLLTFTVTYAIFAYQQTGTSNNQLVMGDIWMSYNESNGIDLSGAMPGDDYSEYFEFTIRGKNTYTEKDIWYDVVLLKGDLPEGKIEDNRILDKYLNFKLVEVNEDNSETIIFTDKTYNDISNKRIHVEIISKNQTEEYNKTYRLYMIINDKLIIGNTSDSIMTVEDYKDAFASVKVAVTGDFEEKEISIEYTPESCFTTEKEIVYTHNKNMTSDELNVCVTYLTDLGWDQSLKEGETIESFCDGTGTHEGSPFQKQLWMFDTKELTYLEENNIITSEITGSYIIDYDKTCGSDVVIPKTVDGIEITTIESFSFSNKQLTSVVIPNSVTQIKGVAFNGNYLTNIVIPNNVTWIGEATFYDNQLASLVFEENSNLQLIGYGAFQNNKLTTIEIPDSVESIEESAFANNQLEEIVIGKGIQRMGTGEESGGAVFQNNPNLKSLRIDRTCSNIKNIPTIVSLCGGEWEELLYPWLSSKSPYTQAGVTVYGSDGVCDTF